MLVAGVGVFPADRCRWYGWAYFRLILAGVRPELP